MEAARYQNEQDAGASPAGEEATSKKKKKKKRQRRRKGGRRIGSNRREAGELEEGESEARRDSRCFVTARVNPASSAAPPHSTWRVSRGPCSPPHARFCTDDVIEI